MEKRTIVTFFGHSDFQEEIKYIKKIEFFLQKEKLKDVDFYLGGYGKFDEFALKCCREYKSKNPNCKLIYISPYLGETLKRNREFLQSRYDEIIYPPIENAPLKFAICRRNEWMVQCADFIIGYVNRQYGGAYRAFLYAKRRGVQFYNLWDEVL